MRIDFSLYMFELIMDEAWGIKEYSLLYSVLLTQFLICRGVLIAVSDTRKEVKSTLNKFTLFRSQGQEGALTRRFARRVAAATEEASRPLTSASEAPLETEAPAVPLPWVVKPPPSSTLITQSSDLQHQLAKARDEIEAMRAAREKDLQEFVKKQVEMEATLRDHREEQWVEQEFMQ
ncbi:hypothetical protein CJ030_MR3G009907 [Morella rubra]|uniref:Uncharacterized protein n=1 Tax=Morella rubra TaxID=262757 RepID=A0A6A1W8R2_9ROSI|nr:hypothetical protein CJ030_MR3G009907 [Morella rubra]